MIGCPEIWVRRLPPLSYIHVVGKNVGRVNVAVASELWFALDGT